MAATAAEGGAAGPGPGDASHAADWSAAAGEAGGRRGRASEAGAGAGAAAAYGLGCGGASGAASGAASEPGFHTETASASEMDWDTVAGLRTAKCDMEGGTVGGPVVGTTVAGDAVAAIAGEEGDS